MSQTEGFTVLKENTLITNFQPHFHLRGKAMQVEAILPDGSYADPQLRRQLQLQLDDQLYLRRRRGAGVPEGDGHPCDAPGTTTRKANKNNPDPDQWVGYGDRTVDEMAHAWMNVVYLSDDEYKALVEKRKNRTVSATAGE